MTVPGVTKERAVLSLALLVLLGLLPPAAGGRDEVRLSETPPPVQAVVRRELHRARELEIRWRVRNGKPAYEVDAEIDRRDVELIIAEDGNILRKRLEVGLRDLPSAVRQSARKELDEDETRRVTRYEEGGEVWYQVEGEDSGYRVTLWLTSRGRLLRKQRERTRKRD